MGLSAAERQRQSRERRKGVPAKITETKRVPDLAGAVVSAEDERPAPLWLLSAVSKRLEAVEDELVRLREQLPPAHSAIRPAMQQGLVDLAQRINAVPPGWSQGKMEARPPVPGQPPPIWSQAQLQSMAETDGAA